MAKSFDRADVTVPAATAVNLATLMTTEGYTGHFAGSFLEIDAQGVSDLLRGESSADVATKGRPCGQFSRTAPPVVDPSRIWLYSTTGGEIGITFEPL